MWQHLRGKKTPHAVTGVIKRDGGLRGGVVLRHMFDPKYGCNMFHVDLACKLYQVDIKASSYIFI